MQADLHRQFRDAQAGREHHSRRKPRSAVAGPHHEAGAASGPADLRNVDAGHDADASGLIPACSACRSASGSQWPSSGQNSHHHGRTDRRQARSQCGVVQQFMGNATHRGVDPVQHGRMRMQFGLARGDVNPPAAPERDVDACRVEQFPCEVVPASDGVRHQRA